MNPQERSTTRFSQQATHFLQTWTQNWNSSVLFSLKKESPMPHCHQRAHQPAASHVTTAHLFHWCLSKSAGVPWRIRKKFCLVYLPSALQYSNVSNFLFESLYLRWLLWMMGRAVLLKIMLRGTACQRTRRKLQL